MGALAFFPVVCIAGIGRDDGLAVTGSRWNSVQEARREAITKNRFVINPSIYGWVDKVSRDIYFFNRYARCARIDVASKILGLIDGLDIGEVGAFAETPPELEYSPFGSPVVVYMEFELLRISENILPGHICGLWDKTAKATGGNISSFYLRSVSNKASGCQPQRGGEDCQGYCANSSQLRVVALNEIESTSNFDLGIAPDPLEREGTILILLIGGICVMVGLAGLVR